ncbi:MAG: ABC transporter ATP-binding protein [Planctomycetota bacterium]|nr:ABC transporter ATP-binding protein [Planctomycetota bacterium]
MLTLRNISKRFGDVTAVDGVSLELRHGEIFGLLGPNGAGKTTTISMATGLLKPDSGEVDVDGAGSPASPKVRALLGVAPQSLAIYDELTGEQNLRFFGRLYELPSPTIGERVDRLLHLTGLEEKRRKRVGTYSGGMKRRLNLAVALMHDPRLVLFDEPTAGVDPQSRNAIIEIITALKNEGRTILYTTHYMEEAERLCDRVAIIDHGRILALDTTDGLISSHGGEAVVTVARVDGEERIATADPLRQVGEYLRDDRVQNVKIEQPNLEGVFLNLTGRTLRD